MKLLKRMIVFSSAIYFFSSCRINTCKILDAKNLERICDFNKSNKVFIDTPKANNGKQDRVYRSVKATHEKLGLERIDSAYQDFTIRIEYNFNEKKDGIELLAITFKENAWKGMYFSFYERDSSLHNLLQRDSMVVVPKIGWCKFINELFSQEVLTLPNMNSIQGFDIDVADGGYVFVEIGSKNKYRFYYYYSPYILNKTNLEESKRVSNIIKLVNENFSFK